MTITPGPRPPLVSVICHTFNHEAYIASALDGIIHQTTEFPFEIIVHDDASTDQTREIIEAYISRLPGKIRLISQKVNQFSLGRRPTRFTFKEARGKFIALCEGDDYWSDNLKLQKQVDAMGRHPGIEICIHPAMRLSMHTGKQKKSFDHGASERVIDSAYIIARHNQFAPTASVLMRTEAALNLPSWFFTEPDLPVGDFFIEAILGRKGALYLPETMSVYRRGVPGSYTDRFRRASGAALDSSLQQMLYFTEMLRGMPGISNEVLNQRLSYIRLNYALQFLAMEDRERFILVSQDIQLKRHRFNQLMLALMRKNKMAFQLGMLAFKILRQQKDNNSL